MTAGGDEGRNGECVRKAELVSSELYKEKNILSDDTFFLACSDSMILKE